MGTIKPADVMLISEQEKIAGIAEDVGRSLIRDGLVCVVFLAGGEGKRLGFNGPKCLYSICGKPILKRLLENVPPNIDVQIVARDCDVEKIQNAISPHAGFIIQKETFGYDASFTQTSGTFPAGHGAFVQDLCVNVQSTHRKLVFVCQADNPLAIACCERLIGLHYITRSQATAVVVKKKNSEEKIGTACAINDKNLIIEYGTPRNCVDLDYGNAGIYVFDGSFMSKNSSDDAMRYHLRPQRDGSYKREKFIFDLIPLANRSQFVEMSREDVFAPVKDSETAAEAEALVARILDA